MKLTAAALAVLLAASPAFSETGNCFRFTTEEEQAAGAEDMSPATYCSTENGDICFRQKGQLSPRPDHIARRYVPVDRCTKYDEFEEEEKP